MPARYAHHSFDLTCGPIVANQVIRDNRGLSRGTRYAAETDMITERATIRVVLPFHLRTLARVGAEVQLELEGPVTQRSVLDALEAGYPMLRGTIRDHETG